MNKHIYVLGSNSFSAAHFIKFALNHGYKVTGVSRSIEAHPVFLPYKSADENNPKYFDFLQADLNHDLEKIMQKIHKDKPAYVVNFAAQGMVAESWQNPVQWFATNTIAPLKLYDTLRTCDFLEKFVQISTPEVYGSTSGLVQENTNYAPSTPYAVSKAAADMNLRCYLNAYDFPVVFTRAANVFGPCQQLYRIIPRAALLFLTGGTLELHGGGSSIRSFIHINDVADATLRIMKDGQAGDIYHISTERQISIKDLVYLVADIVGVAANKHLKIVGERLGKDTAYLLDAKALKKKLQWVDKITLEQGILEVVNWVKDNKDILLKMPQNYRHKA